MRILVFVTILIWSVTAAAAPVVVPRKKFERITTALIACKGMKKKHRSEVSKVKALCRLELKRVREVTKPKKNPWLGISLFLGGAAVGALLTGLAVYQVTRR